jgi:hypothetical protein
MEGPPAASMVKYWSNTGQKIIITNEGGLGKSAPVNLVQSRCKSLPGHGGEEAGSARANRHKYSVGSGVKYGDESVLVLNHVCTSGVKQV